MELQDGRRFTVPVVVTYGDAKPELTALLRDSQGRLELAKVCDSATREYGLSTQGNVKIWLE